ncbi:hypothetical protein PPRY_a6005 [Pseudoalteromonas prydzensis ACAM 620]|nr:hypothetical protein [Pseudoalteromonas prydzensis ACAM 620]
MFLKPHVYFLLAFCVIKPNDDMGAPQTFSAYLDERHTY